MLYLPGSKVISGVKLIDGGFEFLFLEVVNLDPDESRAADELRLVERSGPHLTAFAVEDAGHQGCLVTVGSHARCVRLDLDGERRVATVYGQAQNVPGYIFRPWLPRTGSCTRICVQ